MLFTQDYEVGFKYKSCREKSLFRLITDDLGHALLPAYVICCPYNVESVSSFLIIVSLLLCSTRYMKMHHRMQASK